MRSDPFLEVMVFFGGLFWSILGLCFVITVMSRLKALEKLMQDQIDWLKYSGNLQKRQADALEEIVDLQRTQSSGPPRLPD